MKQLIRLSCPVLFSTLLTACTIGNGRICGPQTPRAYCDKDAYERLLHPKTYGQYWIKPDMTKARWQQDWIYCGGMPNGDFGIGARLPGDADDYAVEDRKRDQLPSCMQSKGYEHQDEE